MTTTDVLTARSAAPIAGPDQRRVTTGSVMAARAVSALALVGAIVCAGAVAVSAAGSPSDAAFGRGLLEFLVVGVPIAAGLYALRSPGGTRLGAVLLAIGFMWSLTALAQTDASVPYTVGRIATWCVFPGVVYLLLAFPDGRIARGMDRALFAAFLGVLVVLFLGTAPLVESFPAKTLWATCTTDCPANAVFVLDHQPAFLPQLILVREWLVELLWLGLFWSMFRRWRAASSLQRAAMGPVFLAGAMLGVFHIGHITFRQLGGGIDTVIALSSLWTVAIVLVCATLLAAMIRRRMMLATVLARLSAALRPGLSHAQVHDALATALSDSTIAVRLCDAGGCWRDARGVELEWPAPPLPGLAVTTIGPDEDGHAVALIHDRGLCDDPELLESVGGIVLTSWRHERLTNDLGRAVRDVERSRRRIAEAADLARVRIERDLHDGAQQRLVALRIRLTLAEDLLQRDPAAGALEVHELGSEADLALDELRSIARGVYPAALIDRGLPDAIRSLALQVPVSIDLAVEDISRHPVEIESAIYFTCAEAIQNATKHAGADRIRITLAQSSREVRFEVRDDGAGFPTAGQADAGRGMRNMRDRIETAGGRLRVESGRGEGTRVSGTIPLT